MFAGGRPPRALRGSDSASAMCNAKPLNDDEPIHRCAGINNHYKRRAACHLLEPSPTTKDSPSAPTPTARSSRPPPHFASTERRRVFTRVSRPSWACLSVVGSGRWHAAPPLNAQEDPRNLEHLLKLPTYAVYTRSPFHPTAGVHPRKWTVVGLLERCGGRPRPRDAPAQRSSRPTKPSLV